MTSETKPSGNGNGRPKDHRRTLAQILADPKAVAGGGFSLRRAYLAAKIHRGCSLWLRIIRPEQEAWAKYLGYTAFDRLPVREREDVRALIADQLFTAFYDPQGESPGMIKEYRAALNSMTRLRQSLAERKRGGDVMDLPAAFARANR
jgi:hypothetical protein